MNELVVFVRVRIRSVVVVVVVSMAILYEDKGIAMVQLKPSSMPTPVDF